MADTPRQTHRSFTIRVPMERYVQIGDLASRDKMHMNTKVNELLTIGLDGHANLEKAIASFLRKATAEDGE